MTGRASGVKMSPGFAVARASRISFSRARWFLSICCGVASFGSFGSDRSILMCRSTYSFSRSFMVASALRVLLAQRPDDTLGRRRIFRRLRSGRGRRRSVVAFACTQREDGSYKKTDDGDPARRYHPQFPFDSSHASKYTSSRRAFDLTAPKLTNRRWRNGDYDKLRANLLRPTLIVTLVFLEIGLADRRPHSIIEFQHPIG